MIVVDSAEMDGSITTVYATPGPHLVEARYADGSTKASPTAKVGAVETVLLPPPEAPPPAPVAEAPPEPEPEPKPKPKQERDKPLPPLAVYIGGGVAVLAGGLSILSGLDVQSQKAAFDKDPSQENLESGQSKQVRTNVLLAFTGVAVVATGVAAIWLVDWKGKSKDSSVKVGAGPGALLLRGTF